MHIKSSWEKDGQHEVCYHGCFWPGRSAEYSERRSRTVVYVHTPRTGIVNHVGVRALRGNTITIVALTQVTGLRPQVRSVSTARPGRAGGGGGAGDLSVTIPGRPATGEAARARRGICRTSAASAALDLRRGRNKERSRLWMHEDEAAAAGVRCGPNPIQPARPCSSGDGAERAASTGGVALGRSGRVGHRAASVLPPPAGQRTQPGGGGRPQRRVNKARRLQIRETAAGLRGATSPDPILGRWCGCGWAGG
jgi:hypothetical protein